MKKLLISLLVAMTACTAATPVDSDLTAAENAMSQGNIAAAKNIVDKISSAALDQLSADQLARLSIVYMQLADADEPSGNITSAVECYRLALAADTTSALDYYSQLPTEYSQFAVTLVAIVDNIDNPVDIDSLDIEYDSVFIAEFMHQE